MVGMLAATRAVALTRMASSAGSVGMRRAGQQGGDTIPRTVRDTIRPTLPSSVASTVGRLKSHQVRLWTATAGTGQPAPSASRPSASRSCAKPKVSEKFRGDTDSDLGVSEYPQKYDHVNTTVSLSRVAKLLLPPETAVREDTCCLN